MLDPVPVSGKVAFEVKVGDGQPVRTPFLEVNGPKVEVALPAATTDSVTPYRIVAIRQDFNRNESKSKPIVVGVPPPREWKVFIFHFSHMDPGWSALPDLVKEWQAKYIDEVVELCDRTKDEPEARRFVWVIEVAWGVDYYEHHRSKEHVNRFMDCVRRGQVDIGAFYTSVHTTLCGHEELARIASYAAGLRRRYGVTVDSATLNDVSESYTMGLAQILPKSGIQQICFGPGTKAILKQIAPRVPRIYRWQATDGSSVLVGWTPGRWTYSAFSDAGFRGRETIQQFEAFGKEYPYDAIFRQGGYGDNTPPKEEMHKKVLDYQKQWVNPEVRMARINEFFNYLRSRFSSEIPTIHGECPDPWADGTISLAKETGMHRRSQAGLIAAEKWATLASALDSEFRYPADSIEDAYRNLHFYSDHTWGLDAQGKANIEVDAPAYAPWRENWDAKRIYALQAEQLVGDVQTQSLNRLTSLVKSRGLNVVVWNSSSWQRDDAVAMPWDARFPLSFSLIDLRNGEAVPWQREQDSFVFQAKEVPPYGYTVYRVEKTEESSASGVSTRGPSNSIENSLYRVTVNERTGAVSSIWDKRLNSELVDPKSPWGLNQYIHVQVPEKDYIGDGFGGVGKAGFAFGEGVRYVPDQMNAPVLIAGPVYAAIETEAMLTRGPAPAFVKRRVLLYRDLPWIEVRNSVNKRASAIREQIYFAFPFAVEGHVVSFCEEPYAMMRWDRDILPGAWRGYVSTQHWVDVSGEKCGVTWSSLEAPVASLGGINSNQWDPEWHKTYIPDNGHIFSYIMSNIWNCNYPIWQGGEADFSYRIDSHRGACDTAKAAHFGWSHAAPLLGTVAETQDGTLPESSFKGLFTDVDNVIVTAVKRANDGNGWILRLYETGRKLSTTANVEIRFISPRSATVTNLAEEDQNKLDLKGNSFSVDLRANELLTIRLT
jgi:hypothetical protein